ncbi:MAG: alanine racemase [Candidatus Shapirobacteria bacterium]|nr:alanine racemase [Candidatus Shapirobacteria bacterium]MDD4410271.1 alanine racemase [Candidatus Shapirobacteria bacterium]
MNIFDRWKKVYESLNLIEINERNLLNNYDFFDNLGKEQIWPVLKSNAYGHGIRQIAEILLKRDFEYFVVDGYQEVLEIRKITKRPVLMIGTILPSNFSKIKWKNLAIMIQDKRTLIALGKLNKHIKVHLKVNTGMNRQGIEIVDLRSLIGEIKKYPKLELEGVFSHLAGVNDSEQIKRFEEVIKIVENNGIEIKFFHLAATSGVGKIKNKKINAVRLGIGLYGIGKGLKPVLKLKSKITKVREIEKGKKVSYGGTFVATKKTVVGVIPVGYFEGLDRRLSNKGFVKYKNKFYPIVGRVCMNMAIVNFGKVRPKLYDEVEVISNNSKDKNSIEKMAEICETIPYDLLVEINSSIRRTIV